MSYFKVKPKHWWYWITQRKYLKATQAILDHREKELIKKLQKQVNDYYIYGILPKGMEHPMKPMSGLRDKFPDLYKGETPVKEEFRTFPHPSAWNRFIKADPIKAVNEIDPTLTKKSNET